MSVVDQSGVYGECLHYAFILFFVGSALVLFIYLSYKKKLSMDEEAKIEMLREEE